MGSSRHGRKRKTNPATWTGPARNSLGDWQIGTRSSEADPERLRHLPVTIHDLNGVAAHVAGIETPATTYPHRPGSTNAQRDAGAPAPNHRGSLITEPPPELHEVERRVDAQRARGPRMIRTPRTSRDRACNRMAHWTPLRRLAWLRRIQANTVAADAPQTTHTRHQGG